MQLAIEFGELLHSNNTQTHNLTCNMKLLVHQQNTYNKIYRSVLINFALSTDMGLNARINKQFNMYKVACFG